MRVASDMLSPVGERLRSWRERRGLSQLRLGIETGTSARHLSCVETGRSRPSRRLVLLLADYLDVPANERNDMLVAAGYAPLRIDGDAASAMPSSVRTTLRQVLTGFGSTPAVAADRYWNLLDANAGFVVFTAGAAPWLLDPPLNVLRLSLHPDGLAPRVPNLAQWRTDLLAKLRWRVGLTDDANLRALYEELNDLPGPQARFVSEAGHPANPVMSLSVFEGDRLLTFMCTPMVLGTPDLSSVPGLIIKSFLPADRYTAATLHYRFG